MGKTTETNNLTAPPEPQNETRESQLFSLGNHLIVSIVSSLIICALSVVLWWVLNLQEDRYARVSTARVSERVQNEINSQLADRLNALRRMIHRWQATPEIGDDEWLRDTSYLVQDQQGYSWVVRTDKNGWIDWTIAAPQAPGHSSKPDILTLPEVTDTIARMVRESQHNTLERMSFSDHESAHDIFIIVMPLGNADQNDGAIVAGVDSTEFFNAIIGPEMTTGYVLTISADKNGTTDTLYKTPASPPPADEKFLQKTTAGVPPITWDITLTPSAKKIQEDRSSLPGFVLFSGILIALLLGYAIRQRQLANLRESMATRLGRIMNQSSNEIYYFDADTLQFININAGALNNLGYTPREAARLHPYDIKVGYTEETFRKLLEPLRSGEKDHLLFETYHRRKDGTTYPIEVNLQLSRDSTKPLFFAVIQDLSERKKAEYERRRYMAMIDNNNDLIAVVDPETQKYTFVNKGACKALGYSEEELLTMTPGDLRPPDCPDNFSQKAREVLEGEVELSVYDVQYQCRDGSLMDLEVHLLPIIDFTGKKVLLGIGRDITERKKSEAELERARFELERRARDLLRSNQELQQFAYAASHDLQEPLRMVSSYLQLLEEEYTAQLDDDAREYINFAVDGANRMRDLIYDLLAFSQVETQGKPFKNVDCTEAVDTALNDLGRLVNESGVMITYENLPVVRGDFGQLVQVFTNLIGNAIKYCSDKDPKIHIEGKKSGSAWEISVIDNGIGIDDKFHGRIFEIFKRLHTVDEYKGTGIGLALCKRIIERHGGTIGVRSNPEGGSTFYFTLKRISDKNNKTEPQENVKAAAP